MKILLTMNLPYTRVYGGANRSNRSLAEALAARHHSVCVVVPALAALSPITHQQLLEELVSEGIHVSSNGEIDVFNLNGVDVHAVIEPSRLCGYLVEQIREFKPDWTLVSSEDRSQSLLETALKVHSSRVIYLAHTPQMFPFGPAGLYPGKRRTELIGQATAVVTISRFVADYIQKWTGFESFIHHPPHYGSGPFPQCGRFDNGYVLMMNACAVKGISIFLALARALPDLQFAALPGWGTTNAERTALGALPNVILLENRKNLDDILNRTRALLMPSLWVEGFGMAVVDAMLRGIPVLASNYGGLVEAKLGTDYLLPVHPIEHFEDYLDENMLPVPVVPKQDIGPWQNALSRLLSDRALHERQSVAAHDAALRFVSSLSVEPFEDFLLRLVTEPKASRQQFLGTLKDQGRHGAESDAVRRSEGIADLTPEQQALLILRLRKNAFSRAKRGLAGQPIKPVSRDQELPLSFAQQRLWFLDQLEPGNPVYNIAAAVRLVGPLDVMALEHSFNEIVRRHEALRTSFSMVEGQPIQVISSSFTLPLPVLDLSNLSEAEREAESQRLADEESQRAFDLARGPLLRSKLVRLGADDHVLLVTMHHIVSDGWSMGVFFHELSVLYEAFSRAKPSTLAELPIQYVDYAVWQRDWLKGEILETQLSYWKKRLANISTLELPTDRPRPAIQSFRGARHSSVMSRDLTERLKALNRKEGVTLFMTLLAAFQTLLYRYTGQDDVAVGSPIAGRTRTEIEGLIGFFVNTLVLRGDLSGNPTFRELLARVRVAAFEAYAHQDVPFEKLVEELQPQRNLSHSPLFQVMLVHQNASRGVLELSGLTVSPVSSATGTAKFDLILSVHEEAEELRASLEYSNDLFNPPTIERMLGHFETLLRGIVANPEQRLLDLPLLTQAEGHQLLVKWNETDRDYPSGKCVHQLFEEQVERTPDAIAVVYEDQKLTYRELNQRANQLAHHLIQLGVGPEQLVGICIERSLEMVVSVLGILKAGGAYVPLDPEFPKERLAFMLEDAQISVLLTQNRLAAKLIGDTPSKLTGDHSQSAIQVVYLDTGWEAISYQSSENPVTKVTPQNLAYVLYTSGSTGKPKGVAMEHSSLFNLISWQIQSGSAKTLQFASLNFDVSFQEIFSTWCSGGALFLISEEVRRDPAVLVRFLTAKSVQRVFLPFVALKQLAETAVGTQSFPLALREVITAGEQLQTSGEIKGLFDRLSGAHLCNQYGPTESHVVTSFTMADSPPYWPAFPPIGRPIAHAQIYVLDTRLRPVPVGVTGELHIGGLGLARVYLNRPDLSAEKFIPHPFTDEPGARLYKTGDLARYLSDGNIEFLGRIDHQVKIRGFRIELGEIESALTQHTSVRESVVLAGENVPQDKQLVAYIVSNQQPAPLTNDLRSFLKQKLPEYMLPAVYVFLDSLPLTPNGKVDRRALPAPDQSRPEPEVSYVAPRTQVEEGLAKIWGEVLKLDRVGIHDNFFDLGGHSLKATQVMSQLREVFQVEMPLRKLFEHPTVAGLAESLEAIRWASNQPRRLDVNTTTARETGEI